MNPSLQAIDEMNRETTKTNVTIAEETEQWLKREYPDALSMQEAIRTALSDARAHRNVIKSSSVGTTQDK
jgi:uncharacterized membrane protein YebE (DUF533 family)